MKSICAILTGIACIAGSIFSVPADAKNVTYKAEVEVIRSDADGAATVVQGQVFDDENQNGTLDAGDIGVPDVMVSNGKDVVLTDKDGFYELPALEEMTVFITKPAGYTVPVNGENAPQFYYHHMPNGSPAEITRYGGMPATGALPKLINFPLIKSEVKNSFKAVISGDTQPYSNNEVGYVRDSLVKELAVMDDIEFVMIEGDIIGDELSLYPRFKRVMSAAGAPVYVVPGNHDLDYDAEDDAHSFDTFKREWGPTYFSFDIGQVHFVILDDVVYPCKAHSFCEKGSTYNGAIDELQMEWLANDLALVPKDKLIILNMHIPLVSYMDRGAVKHSVDNRQALYQLLEGRQALALAGHTHTLEHFVAGESEEAWGDTLPIPQIITGAACGSWWSGDFDDEGIPMSYQRLGAPRGYLVFEFDGNTYKESFKATGKATSKQMALSFLSPAFKAWYGKMKKFLDIAPPTSDNTPPVNINDLPDTNIITLKELEDTELVANVWNGSKNSQVLVQFDDRDPVTAQRTRDLDEDDTVDPFATRLQMYVFRYASRSTTKNERNQGFELYQGSRYGPADPQPMGESLLADQSVHLWKVAVPQDLAIGVHSVRVRVVDMYGLEHVENKVFEVMEERPAPLYQKEYFE